MIGSLTFAGMRLVPSEHMVDTIEDWSCVRSHARARRRRSRHPQNIVIRQVPKAEVFIVDATATHPASIIAHPTVIEGLLKQTSPEPIWGGPL